MKKIKLPKKKSPHMKFSSNKSKRVTELNNNDAKWFFRDNKNYVNFELPDYLNFEDLLMVLSVYMVDKKFNDICKDIISKKGTEKDYPKNHEGVNYTVLGNKDGAFGWRPFQIIHPVLYIDLLNLITDKNNWGTIVKRFKEFQKSLVECISIPRISLGKESHKAAQVTSWWEEIEQRSIKMALNYDYIFITDISNCYPSIYTHSIEWALARGGKEQVKKDRKAHKPNNSLGKQIDQKIQNMNFGQTNGIPQGSTLMDFIAEIVLGYGDLKLTKILKKELPKKESFKIIRYRDDYRIFVNNPVVGRQILKHLSGVLYDLNMKMNTEKTTQDTDVVLSSIKREKLERIYNAPSHQGYQKEALRIYQISKKYPNSGLVVKELNIFYDNLTTQNELENYDVEVLISIFTMIAVSSPRLIHWVSAIISHLLERIEDKKNRIKIVEMIHRKFTKIPNTSFIEIWLQRISAPLGVSIKYKDKLTKLAEEKIKNSNFWESSWLNKDITKLMDMALVSKLNTKLEQKELLPVIQRDEVELFRIHYDF